MTTLPTTTRKEIQTKRILVVADEETIALGEKLHASKSRKAAQLRRHWHRDLGNLAWV